MPSLSDLSAELKLAIIESLEALQGDKNNFAPGIPLCRTPSRDMINLSCCCKTLQRSVHISLLATAPSLSETAITLE
jgi:hypothetical protein